MSQQFNSEGIFTSTVSFTGPTETGQLKINGGQFLERVKYVKASLFYGSISGHATKTATLTFEGATSGKVNFVQVRQPAGIDVGVIFCGGVSDDDVVTVRAHNTKNTGVTVNTATYDIMLTQFDN